MRAAWSNLVEIHAECEDCGWVSEAANAQGNASQHAARTGHLVGVTVTRFIEYGTSARRRMRPSEAAESFGSPGRPRTLRVACYTEAAADHASAERSDPKIRSAS